MEPVTDHAFRSGVFADPERPGAKLRTLCGWLGSCRRSLAEHQHAPECQWFAGCRNRATQLVPHVVLGEVPTCDECADLGSSLP